MLRSRVVLTCVLAGVALSGRTSVPLRNEVLLLTSDGVQVHATFHAAQGDTRALVLQFHQAESNRAEYLPIAPSLTRAGCAALTVDLRVGGVM